MSFYRKEQFKQKIRNRIARLRPDEIEDYIQAFIEVNEVLKCDVCNKSLDIYKDCIYCGNCAEKKEF